MKNKLSPVLDDVPDKGCFFGGGGSSGGTSTTIQKTEAPEWLKPFQVDIGNRAQALSHVPQKFFPGQTFAGFSPETEQALQLQTQRATQGSPLNAAAKDQLTRTLNGEYLDPATNPAFQKAAGDIQSRIAGQFSAAGRYGSGAQANQANEALSNLAAQTYQGERENILRAGLLAPQIAQQDFFDAAKLAEVGSVREDLEQQKINDQIARFNFAQQEPLNRLANFSGIVNGLNAGGTTTGTQQLPRRSLAADAIGGATAGLGILNLLGVFSDARVKEDIRRVGSTDEGLGVYTYRYKGDPTQTHHMGVMAQEVERIHPEAVGNVGGIKTVRYDRLGMLGG